MQECTDNSGRRTLHASTCRPTHIFPLDRTYVETV